MKTKYHLEITRNALSNHFSPPALQEVIQGNIYQDRPKNQFRHDEIHFDGNAFTAGFLYLNQQEQITIEQIHQDEFSAARDAFGRVTHSWQDFYSHSNYVKLWTKKHGLLPPDEIGINDPDILYHPELKSGKNYGIIEFLAMLPIFSKWITALMPEDSHARMNLDAPEAGLHFTYTYAAAYKQTIEAFHQLMTRIRKAGGSQERVRSFLGK